MKKLIRLSVVIFLFLSASLFLLFWRLVAAAPDIDAVTVSPVESATYICDEEGNILRKLSFAESNRDIVSIDEIPASLLHAVIAIEDERFFEHKGIDGKGILRAFFSGLMRGSFSEGASTITQQLIKNSVFTNWTEESSFYDRFCRKIQEQYLALQLEKRISKEEILTDYLNTINLGSGCYGIQAASRRYWGKDVSDLTLSEAAVLAAIPQNPSGFDPILRPEANRKRRQTVLQYMREQGYINEEEQAEALNDDVYARIQMFNETYEDSSIYSYYDDALIQQVQTDLIQKKGYTSEQAAQLLYSGGLRIYSAQNQTLQKICDEEMLNPENFPENTEFGIDYSLSLSDEKGTIIHYGNTDLLSFVRENHDKNFHLLCLSEDTAQTYTDSFRNAMIKNLSAQSSEKITVLGEHLTLSLQPQASLVLIDQTNGFVRAISGGRGEKTASLTLNRATDTTRQPGSTFKILTAYAPALDAYKKTLASIYTNEPFTYDDGTPVSNWDVTDYSGLVTIRDAITRSINVIAVKCLTEITPRAGYESALHFGISTLSEASDLIQPLALGGITNGVTNLELCNAYATIANQGRYHTPKFYTQVLDRHGELLFSSDDSSDSVQVISPETAFLLTSAMQDVISSPDGTAYESIHVSGQMAAGKTGTTSDYKDIWFAGYTPYYTCCVWGGYDNNDSLPLSSTCHVYNKILWSSVMSRIHEGLPHKDFKQPDSIQTVRLCRTSHVLALENACPDTYLEYFTSNTVPEKVCNIHKHPEITRPPLQQEPETTEKESDSAVESESEISSESDSENSSEISTDKIPIEETETDSLQDLLNRLGK